MAPLREERFKSTHLIRILECSKIVTKHHRVNYFYFFIFQRQHRWANWSRAAVALPRFLLHPFCFLFPFLCHQVHTSDQDVSFPTSPKPLVDQDELLREKQIALYRECVCECVRVPQSLWALFVLLLCDDWQSFNRLDSTSSRDLTCVSFFSSSSFCISTLRSLSARLRRFSMYDTTLLLLNLYLYRYTYFFVSSPPPPLC